MKVLANRYLYKFRELLPEEVELDLFDPEYLPSSASDYDALFVNTTTKINSKTLPDPGNLKFIATGSSGTDHLDLSYLASKNIPYGDAAGCNAVTVAEYVITTLLCFQQTSEIPLIDFNVGIVGKGHVGTEVSRLLTRFSIPHIAYDPPRDDRDSDFHSAHFEEMKACNILTFHTPITHTGEYPTHRLLNRSWFRGANYHLLINSARGEVIDEDLVLEELKTGRLTNAVIDVWQNEPHFNIKLASRVLFATPHIAGYSIQSKIRASQMIINQFCDHMGIQKPRSFMREKKFVRLYKKYSSLDKIILDLHPIKSYDRCLRDLFSLPEHDRSKAFDALRSETPLRDEYTNLQVNADYLEQFPELSLLGIEAK